MDKNIKKILDDLHYTRFNIGRTDTTRSYDCLDDYLEISDFTDNEDIFFTDNWLPIELKDIPGKYVWIGFTAGRGHTLRRFLPEMERIARQIDGGIIYNFTKDTNMLFVFIPNDKSLVENLMQYYGLDKDGKTVYVAMSEKEVINYAKKHPEEGIIRVEDKFKHGYNLKESYIITESLKKWDKKEFEDNSNTYELEMLYESVKNILSAQQKNDLVKFVRKARTADEINTYMTGMLVKDQANESLKESSHFEYGDAMSKANQAVDIIDSAKDRGGKEVYVGSSVIVPQQLGYSDRKAKVEDIFINKHGVEMLRVRYNNSKTKNVAAKSCTLTESFDKEPHEFWYYTKHGIGPGTIPKDVQVLDIKEDDNFGTYIKLDKVLTTNELNYYDLKEKEPLTEDIEEHEEYDGADGHSWLVKHIYSDGKIAAMKVGDHAADKDGPTKIFSKDEFYDFFNESLSEDYEQNLEKLKDLAYKLEVALNDVDVWVDDVWYDGDNRTITVFVTNGDWKHDHWRLDNFLRDWVEKNNLDADVRTNDFESDSDVYDAYHIIKFRSLFNEGYISQSSPQKSVEESEKFSNGTLRGFDPYTFMKNIMRSGQSMNSVRTLGDDYYTIFVSYMNHFGPRGIDDTDTKYSLDIIKETPDGEQTRDLSERDLLWNEVAEKLIDWRQDRVTENPLAESIAQLNEGYSYRKVEKAILQAISNIGGECFETIDNDSCSYRFEGKVSRKALITNLSDALKSTGYTILSDNSGVEVQDNDNWWQGTNIEIYNDTDNQEKGYSFFIIGIYDLS